jgi:uncharacterized protein YndB with AHSA1/START domain
MITATIPIKAPAEKVWQALTDKEQMKAWYFDIPDFELSTGATFNFHEPGEARQFHHQCKIREIDPLRKFSHTWTHPELSKGESVVTWFLEEQNGITQVTLHHEGVENFADGGEAFAPENYQMGWNGFMATLKNYVYGIRKHKYTIEIAAPAAKVWEVLLNEESYRTWTSAFCEGSYYTGKLEPGGRIHFLTPEGFGMYSDVIFFIPDSYVLFQHIGDIAGFEEQPVGEAAERWTGAFEGYTLTEKGGKTLLLAEVDLVPEQAAEFDKTFPKGLEKVKELSEVK